MSRLLIKFLGLPLVLGSLLLMNPSANADEPLRVVPKYPSQVADFNYGYSGYGYNPYYSDYGYRGYGYRSGYRDYDSSRFFCPNCGYMSGGMDNPTWADRAREFNQNNPQWRERAREFNQNNPQWRERAREFNQNNPQWRERAREFDQNNPQWRERAREFLDTDHRAYSGDTQRAMRMPQGERY